MDSMIAKTKIHPIKNATHILHAPLKKWQSPRREEEIQAAAEEILATRKQKVRITVQNRVSWMQGKE
jgi:hypothetical protein